MKVLRDGDGFATRGRRSVVGVGVFDGLHLGHQKVIGRVLSLARDHGALASIVTFDPHPASVLAPENAPRLIGTLDQRLEGFAALGVEQVRIVTFDHELASESATSFVERVLVGELRARDVVVGRDFRFGHERSGDVGLLEREGVTHDFGVFVAPIYGAATRWSSTVVRQALRDADLDLANSILGRPFTLRARVVHGDARGGDLGYPTANLLAAPSQLLPGSAIYAGAVRLADRSWWPAAISVGTRPQFYESGDLLVEVHVLGFDGDLYGAEIDVAFIERLRAEMTFADVGQLVDQIARDVEQTAEVFKKFSPDDSALLE